ncbi:MAG: hypothetical protein IV090_16380 [Candidatus Sericytochromatia bacterium]|nr:hypothetical protein [Candidatus Sericytochromatia bacterium]
MYVSFGPRLLRASLSNLIVREINQKMIHFSTEKKEENLFFEQISGICFDKSGKIFISDVDNQRIFKMDFSGSVTTFAGQNNPRAFDKYSCGRRQGTAICRKLQKSDHFADGKGILAKFDAPNGIVIDTKNNLYVSDHRNNAIRKITPKGEVITLAGGNEVGYIDAQGKKAYFNNLKAIAINSNNLIFVIDNNTLRTIDVQGQVRTFLKGTHDPNNEKIFFNPQFLAIDKADHIYISDSRERIYRVSPSGQVVFVAGSNPGYADGRGKNVKFAQIRGIAIDEAGNLMISDHNNHAIRKMTSEGYVTTLLNLKYPD